MLSDAEVSSHDPERGRSQRSVVTTYAELLRVHSGVLYLVEALVVVSGLIPLNPRVDEYGVALERLGAREH